MLKVRYTRRITVLPPQMCFLISSLVKALILMWLHTRKFQKIIQDFTLWRFELLITSFWNSSLLRASEQLSIKEKLRKVWDQSKAQDYGSSCFGEFVLVDNHTSQPAFRTDQGIEKVFVATFFVVQSLNDLTSLDLGTIIWCLGENWSSLVTLYAGYFKIDLWYKQGKISPQCCH